METNGHSLARVDRSAAIEIALVQGDLSKLTTDERIAYYNKTCESLGLSPWTKPFEYLNLNGKLVLYALRAAADQLRKLHDVSISIVGREQVGDVYVVTARAALPSGRTDESTGAVALGNAKGEALANLYLKCETKAKRRVTLSICGLGMLDQTEVETIPGAVPFAEPQPVAAMPQQTQSSESEVDEAVVDLWRMRFEAAESAKDVEMLAKDCKAEVSHRATLLAISAYVNAAKARLGVK